MQIDTNTEHVSNLIENKEGKEESKSEVKVISCVPKPYMIIK